MGAIAVAFLFYDLTGIVVWASLLVTGGMLLHRQTETLLSVPSVTGRST
jgi:membrane protein DedA with SNARE-associated domain